MKSIGVIASILRVSNVVGSVIWHEKHSEVFPTPEKPYYFMSQLCALLHREASPFQPNTTRRKRRLNLSKNINSHLRAAATAVKFLVCFLAVLRVSISRDCRFSFSFAAREKKAERLHSSGSGTTTP